MITGLGCVFGNNVLMGLPLVLLTFGEAGSAPFIMLLSVSGLIPFSLTSVLLEISRHGDGNFQKLANNVIIGLSRNPIVLVLVMGVGMNLSGKRLPLALDRVAEHMQQSVAACALFSLAMS